MSFSGKHVSHLTRIKSLFDVIQDHLSVINMIIIIYVGNII